ncbi:lysophospholipid acyltransferase family protein [Desulfobulbus sp. US4]|nr:lysophospholipid acyltransferase family protein [Desulfobulbus sp. US4]
MINFLILSLKDIIRWMYWGPVRILVRIIPRELSYRLIWFVGLFAYFMSKRKKDRLRRWMQQVSEKPAPRSQVIDVFVQYYRNSLDTLLYGRLSPKNIDQFIRYEGLDNLTKALLEGKGVILLHPHFGNEECLMPAIGHKGFTVSQIASRWEPDYTPERIFTLSNRIRRHAWRMRISTRENLPVGFVYIDEGIRNIYRLLRRNEVLLLALDGREGVSWQKIPFLGMTAEISPGPMKIARSTGAAVLPTVIVRTGRYRHTVHIGEPVKLSEQTDNTQETTLDTVRADTITAVQAVEPYIKKHPAQYAKFILLDVKLFKEEKVDA